MTIPLTLFCVVHGDLPSNAFSVKISNSETVDELRDMVKTKKSVDFKDLDADRLKLWRVLVPMGPGTQRCAITLDAHSWSQSSQPEELLPTVRLHTLYPEGAPEGAIHIIVQRPAQVEKLAGIVTLKVEIHDEPQRSFAWTTNIQHTSIHTLRMVIFNAHPDLLETKLAPLTTLSTTSVNKIRTKVGILHPGLTLEMPGSADLIEYPVTDEDFRSILWKNINSCHYKLRVVLDLETPSQRTLSSVFSDVSNGDVSPFYQALRTPDLQVDHFRTFDSAFDSRTIDSGVVLGGDASRYESFATQELLSSQASHIKASNTIDLEDSCPVIAGNMAIPNRQHQSQYTMQVAERLRSALVVQSSDLPASPIAATQNSRSILHAYNETLGSYVQAIMTGQEVQAKEIKTTIESLFNALQLEIIKSTQLQTQVLENQSEVKRMQEKLHEAQEKMFMIQHQTIDRLAVIQNRLQALITQTYELHEYPIPRLFIVLPKDPELWDKFNPFTHKFRLYFLCECGDHTRIAAASATATNTTANSNVDNGRRRSSTSTTNNNGGGGTKLSHHVHIAKHEGYDLQRTTEFFDKYGAYVLSMMQMVKFGIVAAGTVVPAMAQLKLVERIDGLRPTVDLAKLTLGALMDETISYVQNRVTGNTIDNNKDGDDGFNQEALEGADLRQLESFLKTRDQCKVLGNLYRIVTAEGHVKWVCLDHYRDSYKESATAHLRDLVTVNCGVFNEQNGSIEISLESPSVAKEFYDALIKARGIQELSVKLAWDATKADLLRFHHAIMKSNIVALYLDGSAFNSPSRDIVNRGSRFDPILWLTTSSKLQSFGLSHCNRFFERLNNFGNRATSHLRTLRWDDQIFSKISVAHQEIAMRLYKQCPNLKELIFDCVDMDSTYSIAKGHFSSLPNLSTLRLVKTPLIDDITIHVKDGEILSMDVILEEALKTQLLFSGFVKSLTLSNYFFADYDPEHFYAGNFLAVNPNLERLTVGASLYSLYDIIHRVGILAHGALSSLAVTVCNGSSKDIAASLLFQAIASDRHHVATDSHRITVLNFGLPNFELHVLYWYYPELNLARIRDSKAFLLDQIFNMHPRSAKELTLGISELSKSGVESVVRFMNNLEPEVIEIFNYKVVEPSLRHLFVSGLDPRCCSKVTKLQLMYQELDAWIQGLSKVMIRASFPLLQSLAIADIPGSSPLSTQSACWIASMTCRPMDVEYRPLTWISITGLSFSEGDWDHVLSSMDLICLGYLSLEGCNLISKERLFTLIERFPEKALVEEITLPGTRWLPSMDPDDSMRIRQILEGKTGRGVRVA